MPIYQRSTGTSLVTGTIICASSTSSVSVHIRRRIGVSFTIWTGKICRMVLQARYVAFFDQEWNQLCEEIMAIAEITVDAGAAGAAVAAAADVAAIGVVKAEVVMAAGDAASAVMAETDPMLGRRNEKTWQVISEEGAMT